MIASDIFFQPLAVVLLKAYERVTVDYGREPQADPQQAASAPAGLLCLRLHCHIPCQCNIAGP